MRNPDPIADNQTEQTIIALINGNADDATRDHATAALLVSVQKLISQVTEIEKSLWRPEDLTEKIDERCRLRCTNCTIRQYVQELQKKDAASAGSNSTSKSGNFWDILVKNPVSVGLVFICIALTAAVVYLATGREGFRDITDAVHLTKEKEVEAPSFPRVNQWMEVAK